MSTSRPTQNRLQSPVEKMKRGEGESTAGNIKMPFSHAATVESSMITHVVRAEHVLIVLAKSTLGKE